MSGEIQERSDLKYLKGTAIYISGNLQDKGIMMSIYSKMAYIIT